MDKKYITNSEGIRAEYLPGDRVYHSQARKYATVVEQVLTNGGLGTCFWGNVILTYDNDDTEKVVPPWQLSRVVL